VARYTEDIIAQLKAHADIAMVVQRFVPLRQRGKSWLGTCPFHDDRKPSMYVTPSMGIYKCFACGAGGDVIKFVMDHEKIDFNAAVEMVAEETGFALPSQEPGRQGEMEDRAVVLALNELARDFFKSQLRSSKTAMSYLEKRGVSPETAELFGIGYAPDAWEGLIGLAASKGFSPKQLVLAGLANEKDAGGVIDKFRGRLMISIQNLSHKVVAFGGRILVDGTNAPKYMNSPETPLYHKSDILFGLNHARASIEKSHEAIVVEGYFDLISMFQAGITNLVAASGTAFTEAQARILARYARRIVLVFDGDGAGRKAARKSLEVLLPLGLEIRILVLPDNADPDEFVRENGPDAFRQLVTQRSRDFLEFLDTEIPTSTPEERSQFLGEVRRLIATIQDPLLRQEYLKIASQRYSVERRLLNAAHPRPPKAKFNAPQEPAPRPALSIPRIEERFLNLMIHNPSLWKVLHSWFDPDLFESSGLVESLDHGLAIYEELGHFDLQKLTTQLNDDLRDLVQQLPEETWNENNAQVEFLATLAQITVFRLQRSRQTLQSMPITTDEQVRSITDLRMECSRLIRQFEAVKSKLGSDERNLSSASLLWNGLREQLPHFFSRIQEIQG